VKEKAKSEFSSKEYNHSVWFFGSNEDSIPRWAAYSLGFRIVEDYLKKTGKTAAQLVSEDAGLFIK
jgi:uncharacterized protein YjaZ